MSKNSFKIRIAHLFPDILQGFSDDINVKTLFMRSKWRNIEVEIAKIFINEKIQPSKYDFYYIGGNNTSQIELALEQLKQNKDSLYNALNSKIPMLAINCGYILFGGDFKLYHYTNRGIEIFAASSIESNTNNKGYIQGSCSFLDNIDIVGFENHSIKTYLEDYSRPFLTINKGFGNNGKDSTEGIRVYNAIGSYIISPLLAQNPLLCDFLISQILSVKYKDIIPLEKLCDDIEFYSHNYIIEEGCK